MLRDGRLGDPQLCHEVAHGSFAVLERGEDPPPGLVGDHREHVVVAHPITVNGLPCGSRHRHVRAAPVAAPAAAGARGRRAQSNHGSSPHWGKTSLRVAMIVRSVSSLGSKPTSQERHHRSTSSPMTRGASAP